MAHRACSQVFSNLVCLKWLDWPGGGLKSCSAIRSLPNHLVIYKNSIKSFFLFNFSNTQQFNLFVVLPFISFIPVYLLSFIILLIVDYNSLQFLVSLNEKTLMSYVLMTSLCLKGKVIGFQCMGSRAGDFREVFLSLGVCLWQLLLTEMLKY